MSGFIQRLQRECKQSPGKAAVLGVLLLVALWVCWPQHEEPPAASSSAAAAAEPPASDPPAESPAVPSRQSFPWQDWSRQYRQEPWKQPASEAPPPVDAFAPLIEQLVRQHSPDRPPETPSGEKSDPPPTPPWQLSGVSLGPGRAVALIDGQAYRQGDTLRWKDQQYTLRRITREGAVLENARGETLRLSLPRPSENPRIQLRRVSARAADPKNS